MRLSCLGAAAVCLGLTFATAGSAATYFADITSLSGSGVSGRAKLNYNESNHSLVVKIKASGLTPGQSHAQHIHGLPGAGMKPIDSRSPTLMQDTDGDGFIELAEGAVTYGPIIIPLDDPSGAFPVANAKGKIKFKQKYDLGDSATFAAGFAKSDVMPFTLREIVLHGANVPAGAGAGTMGEVDGTGGYKAFLPVGSGEIEVAPIPLPAAGWLLVGGVAAMAGLRRRRRTAA